jgi:phage terminase small subunit
MKKRGRKSSASLAIRAVDGGPSRMKPPASLSQPERKVFVDLVATTDAEHFQASDLPLLASYSRAVAMDEMAARELQEHGAVINGRPSPWIIIQEKAQRSVVALAMRLRLSPQSRKQYATAPAKPMSYYQRVAAGLEDDDE